MSDHLIGTIWTYKGQPCRIRSFTAKVWVDFLDGSGMGAFKRADFGRHGHVVPPGANRVYLEKLAEYYLDMRAPFDVAKAQALKAVTT